MRAERGEIELKRIACVHRHFAGCEPFLQGARYITIDLDHVLLYLGWWDVAPDGGRPFTHSLATVVVLLATAAVPAVRIPALGLAVGVVLHLFRDLGTGPGVPLWWPLSGHSVTIPYRAYVAVLTLATIVAVAAALRRRRVSGP